MRWTKEIREVLLNLKSEERIIIVACHDREELERLSDEIIEISAGEIVARTNL